MFACPICNDWVIVAKLCDKCDKVRQLCKLYGRDKLLEILDKTMVIQQHKSVEKQPTCELKIDEN